MTTRTQLTETVPDRIALAEMFNRYADALDLKQWELLDGFFSDDAVGEFRVDKDAEPFLIEGGTALAGFASQMIGSPELATHHMLGNFSATFDGDTATAKVHMRNHHAGVGPRAGQFQESLGTFTGRFVRDGEEWRCTWWQEWIFVNLGDGAALFAPEIAAQAP